tara:strand:- start:53 stop:277 length:225 start_codon:yes stop_codon:yes gene_type:complete
MTSFAEFITQLDEDEVEIFIPALSTNDVLSIWESNVKFSEDIGEIPEDVVFQLQTLAHFDTIPYSYLTKLGIPF